MTPRSPVERHALTSPAPSASWPDAVSDLSMTDEPSSGTVWGGRTATQRDVVVECCRELLMAAYRDCDA